MCKALTGLRVSEFKDVVTDFNYYYSEYQAKRKKNRQRKIGGGRNSRIETIEEKLFYVLWYMKTYPTFDVASFQVGFARSSACYWMHELLPILEMTMKRKFVLPQRKISDPEEYFRLFPEAKEVFVDAVERLKQRPKKKKAAQKAYSGKKKPRGGELTASEKETNKIISSYRAIVEHAIGGIKRYRCMSEKLRNHKPFIDDQFLLLTAGLWNYHLSFPT